MEVVLVGNCAPAQELFLVGEAEGLRRGETAGQGQTAFLCCEAEELESRATALARDGADVVLPGWMAACSAALLRLDAAFSDYGRKLRVLFLERYLSDVRDVARMLARGNMGRIGMVDFLRAWPCAKQNALYPLAEGLGVVTGWFGMPQTARIYLAQEEQTRCATLTARFAGGELLNLQAVCSPAQRGWDMIYELSGSQGNLCHDACRARWVRYSNASGDAPAERFALLGTGVCPLRAALRALPGLLAEQAPGLDEEARAVAQVVERALGEEAVTDA